MHGTLLQRNHGVHQRGMARLVRLAPQLAAFGLVAATSAPPAAAQPVADTFRLRELVVTATRFPLERAAIPAAVTVLHGEELRAKGVRFVADALRDLAGVSVVDVGSFGGLTSVFLRGGESDYVQVLIDGVQVNDPGGAINLAHLTTAEIERIEVVRGPVSVLYGSDALAGVIQIFTRAGAAATRPRVTGELFAARGARVGEHAEGAYRLLDFSAALTGRTSPGAVEVRYGLSASGVRSDGAYAFNSDYDSRTLNARLALTRGATDAQLTARHLDRRFHYPTTGSGMVADSNKFSEGETRTLGLDVGRLLGDRFELRVALGAHRAEDGEDDPPDYSGDASSVTRSNVERRSLDVRLNARLPRASLLTLGAEGEGQKGQTSLHFESSFGPFESSSDDQRSGRGYYAQLVTAPFAATTLTLGGRFDRNDRFGAFGTYRVGASRESRHVRLHAAAGTGFKEPTFFENFAAGFTRGNPDLQPERSTSLEAGVLLSDVRLHLAVTAFGQTFQNLIQYTATPAAGQPNYHNVGQARSRGLELEGGWLLPHGARARATYTLLDTEVTDQGFGEDRLFQQGRPLLRRPRHEASAGLDFEPLGVLRASAALRHVGKREDLDFTDPAEWQGRRVTLPGHTTLDLSLARALSVGGFGFDAVVQVQNALDARYEKVYNFPARGRLLRLGLRGGPDVP